MTSPNDPSYLLKYFLQRKSKEILGERGEVSFGRLPGETQQSRVGLLCGFKFMSFPLIRDSRDLSSLLLGMEKETPLQMRF